MKYFGVFFSFVFYFLVLTALKFVTSGGVFLACTTGAFFRIFYITLSLFRLFYLTFSLIFYFTFSLFYLTFSLTLILAYSSSGESRGQTCTRPRAARRALESHYKGLLCRLGYSVLTPSPISEQTK